MKSFRKRFGRNRPPSSAVEETTTVEETAPKETVAPKEEDKTEPKDTEQHSTTPENKTPPMTDPTAQQSTPTESKAGCKIYIVFYTMYGHIYQMAQAMKKGVDAVEGCKAELFQVAETLSDEVLQKMHAAPRPDVPVIEASELPNADGLIFGFPTRFGMMCAQMKALFDATGGLWKNGALTGKPAGLFVATGTQGGGQESTCLTALTQLVHHGMIFIPPGYTMGPTLFDVANVRGGSPWGAGTFAAADGSRQPSETELAYAEHQGKYFAEKAKILS